MSLLFYDDPKLHQQSEYYFYSCDSCVLQEYAVVELWFEL